MNSSSVPHGNPPLHTFTLKFQMTMKSTLKQKESKPDPYNPSQNEATQRQLESGELAGVPNMRSLHPQKGRKGGCSLNRTPQHVKVAPIVGDRCKLAAILSYRKVPDHCLCLSVREKVRVQLEAEASYILWKGPSIGTPIFYVPCTKEPPSQSIDTYSLLRHTCNHGQ